MSTLEQPVGQARWTSTALTALTWVVVVLFVFPAFWLFLTALKPEVSAFTTTPQLFFTPTLEQFSEAFNRNFTPYVLNSLYATGMSTVLVLALGIPAAHALSIDPVKRWQDGLFFFISTRMLPLVSAIVPLYIIAVNLGVLDNVTFLTLIYTAMNLPIAIWMLRSFFLEIPPEVREAALVDGANLWQELRHVQLPIMLPGIAATALLSVIFAWNEFFFAVSLTANQSATVPVFLVGFISGRGLFWAQMSAAATMATLPVLLAGWLAQKQLVRGLSFGAVK